MAKELSAAQRALQILAEIESEEELKQGNMISNQYNSLENVSSEGVKANKAMDTVQSKPIQTDNDKHEPASFNLNKLTQNDIINGFVISELLNKPLALRRYRRF